MPPETPALFLTADDLPEIRRNTDWPRLLEALALILDTRRCKIGDWWAHSPFAEDRQASFHITQKGWYCFSTGQGGGALELVQQLRGLSCYAAARWLIDNGISHCGAAGGVLARPAAAPGEAPARSESRTDPPADERLPNPPIRQNLLPRLQPHPELERRGISPATAAYLGCGYFPEGGKSPLAGRIVFQVRGIRQRPDGQAAPVILTHLGRALDTGQEANGGKWHFYQGFSKTRELYNIDRLVLDPEAVAQAQATGHILIVEGCFDVARLVEAGIRNVGATFGAHLDPAQLPRLAEVAAATGISRFRIFFDRDDAGAAGQQQAVALINTHSELTAAGFDWEAAFPSPARGSVKIPGTITDPGEFSREQLAWLRERGVI